MSSSTEYSIGELAQRTGLSVTAIRFYADRGIVPPVGRTSAGHRRYSTDAAARLNAVRTLRTLGVDLPTIVLVLDGDLSLADVVSRQAEIIDSQLRVLRLRRAVVAVVARRNSTQREIDIMNDAVSLSADQRQLLFAEFVDAAFGDLAAIAEFAGPIRSMTPQLPQDPDTAQLQAWIELVELLQDKTFRITMRSNAEHHAAELDGRAGQGPRRDTVAVIRDRVRLAVADNIEPTSPEAGPVLDEITDRYASAVGLRNDVDLRRRLVAQLIAVADPRRDQYFQRLSVVNGWSEPEDVGPAIGWTIRALQAQIPA